MADTIDKVYTPQTIDETPFPQESTEGFGVSQSTSNDTYSAEKIKDQPMPIKRVAMELLSTALNTKSKKILQKFEFADSGALQIGKYENGISGDVRITPNGITARDLAGETTLAIDADTGNATFKGTVQAADFTVIDENGLISLANFQIETIVLDSQITRSDAGWGDANGLALNIELDRPAIAIIIASLSGKNTSLSTTGGQQLIRFAINDTPTGVWNLHGVPGGAGLEAQSATIHYVTPLVAGINTIKVQHRWAVSGNAILLGSSGTDNAGSRLSCVVLGR